MERLLVCRLVPEQPRRIYAGRKGSIGFMVGSMSPALWDYFIERQHRLGFTPVSRLSFLIFLCLFVSLLPSRTT